MVKFINYRELRNTPSTVWAALQRHEALAILANGEPRALMLGIEEGDLERTLELVRRIRAQMALSRLRAGAAERGADRLGTDAIDAEVRRVRTAKRTASRRRRA